MNILKKLSSSLGVALLVGGIVTSVFAHDAKVVKLTGSAEIQLPGQTAAKPLTADMVVPEGSIITTATGGQVFLEAFSGAVATIGSNSQVLVEKLAVEKQGDAVTSQEALLDLKKGSVISTIDPTKKAINHYGVRTPKGVASARGTVYGVTVNTGGTSVATLNGTVTLNLGNGVFVSIPFGSGMMNNAETVSSLAKAIADSGQDGLSVSQLLQEAVKVVADNVAASTSAAGSSDTSTALLASVVSAAATADPANAAGFVKTAVAAASSNSSSTSGSVDAAVSAIVEAGVRAAPGSTADIGKAAAAAVVETKVTEAVNAAKANGQDPAAAADAAATAAQGTVSAIAQTVVNTVTATNSGVNLDNVVASINEGSKNGATDAGSKTGTTPAPNPPSVVTTPTPAAPSGDTSSAPIVSPVTEVPLPPVSPSGG